MGLPEIAPHIRTCTPVDPNSVLEIQREFSALPAEWWNDLLRSMRRFTLSQCRYEMIDRVLDLALSFEVPFSNKGDSSDRRRRPLACRSDRGIPVLLAVD